jgi:hypothetical protein
MRRGLLVATICCAFAACEGQPPPDAQAESSALAGDQTDGVADALTRSFNPIDFCGNGIDEDGDGADRVCMNQEGYPTTRSLIIRDRGAAESIETREEIHFPYDAQPFVRLVNQSSFRVDFWGNLTPGWLHEFSGPVPDELLVSVGVPGKIQLSPYPDEVIIVRLVRDPPPSGSIRRATAYLSGTAKQNGFGRMNAELELMADGDGTCPEWQGDPPVWTSVDECVGRESCAIAVRATLRLKHPRTGEILNEYTILPPQCRYVEGQAHYASAFRWDGAEQHLSYSGSATWLGGGTRISLEGTAAGVHGEATIVDGTGTIDLTFAGAN